MKHHIKKFLHLFKKKKVYIPAIIIVVVVAWYFWSNRSSQNEEIIMVAPATFVQEVAVTGKVVASKNVNLGFNASGRIAKIAVKVGDKVREGATLSNLANADTWANVQQKQAALDAEKADYAQVIRGSRAEDISIAETDAAGAETSFNQSLQGLINQMRDSYAKSDDAVRGKIDPLYTDPRGANPQIMSFEGGYNSYELRQALNAKRIVVGEMLASWNKSLASLSSSSFNDSYVTTASANLGVMNTYLNDLTIAVSGFQASSGLTQATIDAYKANISAARSAISTSIASLNSAQESYRSAQTAYTRAKQQLELKRAGSTVEDVAAAAAQVKSAEANLQNANALYAQTVIRAPFSGVITKVDIKEGEIVSPSASAISMITDSAYEIESYISESDISKIKVGQIARVTLDAYGKETFFEARVVHIDPAETVMDGVSTYKIKLEFTTQDPRIRSGMTANITIQTAEEPGSVVIPQEALFLQAGEKMVTVIVDGKRVTKKVVTGGIDANGGINVMSGVVAGDKLVVPTH